MQKALIAVVLVFATGAVAAVASDVMGAPSPPPRAVPPVPPTATIAPPPGGRQTVLAPIDGLAVNHVDGPAPRYVVNVLAGLPSGCAQRDSHTVARAGDVVTITVLNSMPPGNPICTMIYGQYELNVDLGSAFTRGTTYTVRVNDKTTTFTPR